MVKLKLDFWFLKLIRDELRFKHGLVCCLKNKTKVSLLVLVEISHKAVFLKDVLLVMAKFFTIPELTVKGK